MSLPNASVAQIRTVLISILSDIADIGRVHAYARHSDDPETLLSLYQATIGGAVVVRGWHVQRRSTRELHASNLRAIIEHTWTLQGFWAVDDGAASALAFDAGIEAICDAIRADRWLGGLLPAVAERQRQGVQVEQIGNSLLAGVLCHSARLSLVTQVWVDLDLPEDPLPPLETIYVGQAPFVGTAHQPDYVPMDAAEVAHG